MPVNGLGLKLFCKVVAIYYSDLVHSIGHRPVCTYPSSNSEFQELGNTGTCPIFGHEEGGGPQHNFLLNKYIK